MAFRVALDHAQADGRGDGLGQDFRLFRLLEENDLVGVLIGGQGQHGLIDGLREGGKGG